MTQPVSLAGILGQRYNDDGDDILAALDRDPSVASLQAELDALTAEKRAEIRKSFSSTFQQHDSSRHGTGGTSASISGEATSGGSPCLRPGGGGAKGASATSQTAAELVPDAPAQTEHANGVPTLDPELAAMERALEEKLDAYYRDPAASDTTDVSKQDDQTTRLSASAGPPARSSAGAPAPKNQGLPGLLGTTGGSFSSGPAVSTNSGAGVLAGTNNPSTRSSTLRASLGGTSKSAQLRQQRLQKMLEDGEKKFKKAPKLNLDKEMEALAQLRFEQSAYAGDEEDRDPGDENSAGTRPGAPGGHELQFLEQRAPEQEDIEMQLLQEDMKLLEQGWESLKSKFVGDNVFGAVSGQSAVVAGAENQNGKEEKAGGEEKIRGENGAGVGSRRSERLRAESLKLREMLNSSGNQPFVERLELVG